MSILEKHVLFVNEQIEFHKKQVAKFANNPFRQKLHVSTVEKFQALAADIGEAEKMLAETENRASGSKGAVGFRLRLTLTPDDIEGLPDDLLQELSINDADKSEFAILALIDEAGGVMSLDQLIIGLFRKTKEIHKRQTLTSRLYRMAQKEQIFSVPNKKGVYSNRPLSVEEVAELTGN